MKQMKTQGASDAMQMAHYKLTIIIIIIIGNTSELQKLMAVLKTEYLEYVARFCQYQLELLTLNRHHRSHVKSKPLITASSKHSINESFVRSMKHSCRDRWPKLCPVQRMNWRSSSSRYLTLWMCSHTGDWTEKNVQRWQNLSKH